jgi:hypothetical protein
MKYFETPSKSDRLSESLMAVRKQMEMPWNNRRNHGTYVDGLKYASTLHIQKETWSRGYLWLSHS